jgi:putative sugar O-methyltransferase
MTVDIALDNYEIWLTEIDKSSASWYWKKHAFREDRNSLLGRLDSFRSTEVKPLSDTLDDYKSKMSMQEMYDCLCQDVPESLIEELSENQIGNPPIQSVVTRSGIQISTTFNDLILISFSNKIFNALSTKQKTEKIAILEIGGGYGGLVAKLKKMLPKSNVVVVDIPHAGLLQTYYLGQALPFAKLAVHSINNSLSYLTQDQVQPDFFIVPNSKTEDISHFKFDLIINSRSFMEMDQKEIAKYFELIQKTLKPGGLFLNCNRLWKNAGDKPTQISRYPYDDKWSLVSLSTSFFQNNTIEILTRRSSISNPLFLNLVRNLPKTDYLIHKLKFQGLVEWLRAYMPSRLTLTYWKMTRKFNK